MSINLLLPARLGQHEVVQSRHPGRYPKLESPTLSYPAFEPLTERHAFPRTCDEVSPINALGVRLTLSVCLAAQQVSGSLELRTMSILLPQMHELQDESTTGSVNRPVTSLRAVAFRQPPQAALPRSRYDDFGSHLNASCRSATVCVGGSLMDAVELLELVQQVLTINSFATPQLAARRQFEISCVTPC